MDQAYWHKTLNLPFVQGLARTKAAFQAQGFGLLTEIDVQATLQVKLNQTTQPYYILGWCLPQVAAQALAAAPQVGLFLPCKAIVYALDQDKTVLSVVKPESLFGLLGQPGLTDLVRSVSQKMEQAFNQVN